MRSDTLSIALFMSLLLCGGCGNKSDKAKAPKKTAAKTAAKAPAKAAAKAPAPNKGVEATAAAKAQVDRASAALGEARQAVEMKKAREDKRAKVEALVAERSKQTAHQGTANQLPKIAPGTIEKQMLRVRVAPGEDVNIQPKWLVKRIRNVAANHDAAALKRWCTPELQREMDQMLGKHAERFWRHLDRYAKAGGDGYEVTEERPEGEEMHLTVKARGDIVLKPVMKKTAEGWRFHRF